MKGRIVAFTLALILLFDMVSFAASNNTTSSSASPVLTQSYRPPAYLSTLIGILLIVLVFYVGFKFLKKILSAILLLILLFIIASVAYSFLTTGTITLSGASGFINSILDFLKAIVGLSHTAASAINSTGKSISAINSTLKVVSNSTKP